MTTSIKYEIKSGGKLVARCASKQYALASFANLNETEPDKVFSVFEVVTTREKIAESEDRRQTRFEF